MVGKKAAARKRGAAARRSSAPKKARRTRRTKLNRLSNDVEDSDKDEATATEDEASDSESSKGRGTTSKIPKPASKGKTAYEGKPTLSDALGSKMVRNTVMHKLVEDITEDKDDADSELRDLLFDNNLTTMLIMVPGSAYPLLAHSVFQYNSRARQADENHRDIIIFIGDRTMVGDPTGFIMDVDTKLEIEVECIDDDEGISDFIQDVKNDGKLLVQSESALASSNMKTKQVVFMMPVNDNVADYVAKESPSLYDLDAWINAEDNDKVEDSEAAALNDWIQVAVQTDTAGKKKRKSSIIAHEFQPITGPSEELVKAMESRLDVTMGCAPESTKNQPREARGATWDVQLEQRFEAQERRLREDAKRLQSDKDSWSDRKWARWCAWSGQGTKHQCSPTLKKLSECKDADDGLTILQNGWITTAYHLRLRQTSDAISKDIIDMLMKGQPVPAAASIVPIEANVPKTFSHMTCVLMTSAQREELARQERAVQLSVQSRTLDEARRLEEKEISGKLAKPPPSTYRESVQVYEDAHIRAANLLTEDSELTKLYAELGIVLRRIAPFADDIPAETWVALSAHVYYDENQFFAVKASEADVIDGTNLPQCVMGSAGVLQTLLVTRTVPAIHNPLPTWKASRKPPRDPIHRGTWGSNFTSSDATDDGNEVDHSQTYDRNVPEVVKSLMLPYWKKFPGIQVRTICDLGGVTLSDFPQAIQGVCFNKLLGKCNNYNCPHSHDFSNISNGDLRMLCHIIEPGVRAAVEGYRAGQR